jgi:hypothetical protein
MGLALSPHMRWCAISAASNRLTPCTSICCRSTAGSSRFAAFRLRGTCSSAARNALGPANQAAHGFGYASRDGFSFARHSLEESAGWSSFLYARDNQLRSKSQLSQNLLLTVARGAVGRGGLPNRIPVSTSNGCPSLRYGLNLHWPRASVIAFA